MELLRQSDYDVAIVVAMTILEVAPMKREKKVSACNVISLRTKGYQETKPFRAMVKIGV